MKAFLEFIEKHKSFIKKLVLFTIFFLINTLVNNPTINAFFQQIFGETLTATINPLCATMILGGD